MEVNEVIITRNEILGGGRYGILIKRCKSIVVSNNILKGMRYRKINILG